MKVFTAAVFLTAFATVNGLMCWHCYNQKDNDACLANGFARRCLSNELFCFSEVRRGSDGRRIFKRCKQPHACDNNFIQNPRAAWQPSQCNPKVPSSVCRCCCNQDLCNQPTELCINPVGEAPECRKIRAPRNGRKSCFPVEPDFKDTVVPGTICEFECNFGYSFAGEKISICEVSGDGNTAAFNNPPPTCTPRSCLPRRRHPANGRVGCTDRNNLGSECTYRCNPGYRIAGEEKTRCLSTMRWSNLPPMCTPLRCNPPHVDPENGSVRCSNENFLNSFCRFTCDTNFALNGRPSSICRDDGDGDPEGVWSYPPPTCRMIVCEPPHRDPTNGEVSCTQGNLEGSVCTFTCRTGYSLEGRPTSTCRDDNDGDRLGRWSSRAPLCRRIRCNPPHVNPRNGEVFCSNENNEGSLCIFSCTGGYYLDGSANSLCEDDGDLDDNGAWSQPAPTCRRITCRPPHRDPANGDVDCSDANNEGSVCSFNCDAGYFLNGAPASVCEDDGDNDALGEWSTPAPTCSRVVCRPPQTDPTNGNVDCTDANNVDSVCSFTCDARYFLSGSPSTTCNDDNDSDSLGEWSDPAPVCQPITCSPSFENPTNGAVRCSNRNNILGTTCRFTCGDGFFLRGSAVSRCVDDNDGDNQGVWNRPAPVCIQITCPPPHVDPNNGEVSCSDSNNAGSVCRFTCDNNYFLQGSPASTCNDDDNGDAEGEWSSPAPTCVPIRCSPGFSDPRNGEVSCDDPLNNVGTTCSFTCNDGYFLNGSPSSECVDDDDNDSQGVWSTPAPTCSRVTCPPPHVDPRNGEVSCTDSNNDGSECSFTCDALYFLDGSPTSICNDNNDGDSLGEWSAPAPTCVPITCSPDFSDPANGGVSCNTSNNIVGTVCSFTCDDTYALIGEPQSTCRDDGDDDAEGLWSSPAPVCQLIVCNPPHRNPRNGEVSCIRGNVVGSVCTFTCSEGYSLDGEPVSTCVDDNNGDPLGEWSSPAPMCRRIMCNPPHSNPDFGSVDCSDGNNEGSLCVFTCNAGYALEGDLSSTCNDDGNDDEEGEWSAPPPRCAPIRCSPSFTDPTNGAVDCSDPLNNLGTECSFTCEEGYFLNGSPISVCNDDDNGDAMGAWSEDAPTCIRITCPPPHVNPRNGLVDCTDENNEGSVCSFTCDAGFYLMGSDESTCADNNDGDEFGDWSTLPPTCQPITCVGHTDPRNGEVSCDDPQNGLGTVCSFTCDEGYFLQGSAMSTCQDDFNGDPTGAWSTPAPTCSRVLCLPPHVDPENGDVDCTSDNNEGSVCSFTCDEGYFLDGPLESECLDDNNGDEVGVWTPVRPPVCVLITCSPRLTAPENGNVACDNPNDVLGTQCTFVCDDDYFLSGSEVSTCVDDNNNDANGVWDEESPVCIRIVCPPPHVDPVNGGVSCSDSNNLNSRCDFSCDAGYFLDGSPVSNCNDDGNDDAEGVWDADAPICVPIRCFPSFDNPENGNVDCTDPLNNLGTECSFTCDDGYYLEGSSGSTCQDDNQDDAIGDWSDDAPTCVRVTCPPPREDPTNGAVDCTDLNNQGSECSYTCDAGFFLQGDSQTLCEDDFNDDAFGVWTNPPPTCVPIRCSPSFTDPDNGDVTCDNESNNLGTVCNFRCDGGYFLRGEPSSECIDINQDDATGDWSNPAPTCIAITCEPPHEDPLNGNVDCTNENRENSNCVFTCNENYALVGTPQSRCLDDNNNDEFGEWTSQAPVCQLIVCEPRFTSIENGNVECTNDNVLNSICEFTCSPGFDLEGAPSSTCVPRDGGGVLGDWTVFPAPVCIRVGCGEPPDAPSNGFRVCTDGTFLGSQCEYGCENFHTRVGPLYSVCVETEDGLIWDREAPVCRPNVCPEQTLPHGVVECSTDDLIASTNCQFRCTDEGYVLYPAEITENDCLNDTTWSIPRPCCAANCPPLARIDLNIIMDASSSIGENNWVTMLEFVQDVIRSFTISDDAARVSVFSFNNDVDMTSQILFNRFPNDQEGLLEEVSFIEYDGVGTLTGQALEHARDTIFTRASGDRPNVADVILVITDGRSQDEVAQVAQDLRDRGITIYVLGVIPPTGQLDGVQLQEIAGDPDNVIIATSGFAGLDEEFAETISNVICPDPCSDDPRA